MKGLVSFILDSLKILIIALLIVLPIRAFVFQPFLVRGASMEPNFHNGDYLIVDELSYRFRDPSRGEVVVLRFPGNPSQNYIKRIIGLPGETVEVKDGKVFITRESKSTELDEEYLSSWLETPGSLKKNLGEKEYFVMGDNRPYSSDSRAWGTLEREFIVGKALLRVFPLNMFTAIAAPTY
ncbi:MAG: signal peptidase I [Candidatus Wildermuthbacteria bacterium]|nr:signal peptidase I [Candidatus Wildermuthbacteria bacterium]